MKQILKLAMRNIWRNKRRTLITAASILFAVFFAIAISSIQEGTWNHMINSVVSYHYGYVQIHQQGYWDDKTIDNSFDPRQVAPLVDEENVEALVPRIESFALASHDHYTKGALIIGIDPSTERNLTYVDTRVSAGDFLRDGDDGAMIAEGLADYLNIGLGDTLVLISQGYHGINAAGKFPIRGLVHFGTPELNKQLIYIELKRAQWFYGCDDLVTALVVDVRDQEGVPRLVRRLKSTLDTDQYEVMDYKEMMPDLIQAKEVDTAGAQIILMILYFIIGFGIFGTILMMLKERQFEFGILKAIGMRTSKLNLMLWLETIFLGIIGCLAGMIVSFPIVYYFYKNPIVLTGDMATAYEKFGVEALLPAALDPGIFITQAIVIFLMITVLSIYPMFKLARLKPVEAMRA